MKVQEIFTPNDIPTVTYVDRSEHKFEGRLKNFYETPNMVVSISGPSKSGKTVLINKVVPEDYLITVRGAGLTSAENLWERVLAWMGGPIETTVSKKVGNEFRGEVEAGGKAGLPFIAEASTKGKVGGGRTWGTDTTERYRANGLEQVIDEIAKSEFVVFIDDFHYIAAELRDDVGKQIKVAAEAGVKIFTASVPHRADDVVRSNPELRGRVAALDLAYWSELELVQFRGKALPP